MEYAVELLHGLDVAVLETHGSPAAFLVYTTPIDATYRH